MFNFFNKRPKAEFIKNPTMQEKIDKEGDPLNDWHGDNPKGYENLELTDEEIERFEMSSDFKTWKDIEEFSAEDSIDQLYQNQVKVEEEDQDENQDEEEDLNLSEFETVFELGVLPSIDPNEIDDYNLMEDLAQKKIQREQATERLVSEMPLYSTAEIDLMQRAYVYKTLSKGDMNRAITQPVYADGVPLSDAYITQQVATWEQCKKNNEYAKYNANDINLMKKCTNWKKLQDYILRGTQYPTGLDGNPLRPQEIEELANEFVDYTQDHLDDFIENQIERGNWHKEKLSFKTYKYNSREQWTAYKKLAYTSLEKKDLDLEVEMVKFISREKPIPFNEEGEYLYAVQEDGFKVGNAQIVFIKTLDSNNLTKNLIPKKPRENLKKSPAKLRK